MGKKTGKRNGKPRRTREETKAILDGMNASVNAHFEAFIEKLGEPELFDQEYQNFLNLVSHLWKYSPGNICLARDEWQCRINAGTVTQDLSLLGSFDDWRKAKNPVEKGQKGIPIQVPWKCKGKTLTDEETGEEIGYLAPRTIFRLGHIYDVSQTVNKTAPSFAQNHGKEAGDFLPDLLAFAEENGIEVRFQALTVNIEGEGYVAMLPFSHRAMHITLRSTAAPGIQFATLLHELAHWFLHCKHEGKKGDQSLPRRLEEGEAEAVSVVVLKALGFDAMTSGAKYVQYAGCSARELKASLGRIQSIAKMILRHLMGETEKPLDETEEND